MIDLNKFKLLFQFAKNLRMIDILPLINSATKKKYPPKTILVEAGQFNDTVYFVTKGLVRQYHLMENGEEKTIGVAVENLFFLSFESVFLNEPAVDYHETLEPCEIYQIPWKDFNRLVAKNKNLSDSKTDYLIEGIKYLANENRNFKIRTPEERYQEFISTYKDIANRLPDKYIASIIGVTPVSLSRIRSRILTKC